MSDLQAKVPKSKEKSESGDNFSLINFQNLEKCCCAVNWPMRISRGSPGIFNHVAAKILRRLIDFSKTRGKRLKLRPRFYLSFYLEPLCFLTSTSNQDFKVSIAIRRSTGRGCSAVVHHVKAKREMIGGVAGGIKGAHHVKVKKEMIEGGAGKDGVNNIG